MMEAEDRIADMVVMGWQGGFSVGRIYNTPVQRIIKGLKADLSVLKDRGVEKLDSIVLPWGGGLHARLGLEIGIRMARASGAKLRILRLVKEGTAPEQEKEELMERIKPLIGDFQRLDIAIRQSEDVTGGIFEELNRESHDLVIIGASREWGISNVLFGTIPDIVADKADCSVLMVRRYVTEDWKLKASEGYKQIKEQLGLSSSPDAQRSVS
jgi:nucleotide-binding universal stress UspA family protein